MSQQDIIRAWKDVEYRNSLSAAERAALPDNPAGLIELTPEEQRTVAGGQMSKRTDERLTGCCALN